MAYILEATITCNECGDDYEGFWSPPDKDEDLEDMAEAPVAGQTCPSCGHTQVEEYPGWSWRTEAG